MKPVENISLKLESVFQRIRQERMQDMPVCNPALQVQAIGFKEWGDYYLGVMVTPWFMNLMLLPGHPDVFADIKEGGKQMHDFPSGSYEFVTAKKSELGDYQVCSLFSPMQEFADQETAVQTANLVLYELMEAHNKDTSPVNGEGGTGIMESPPSQPKRDQDPPMSRRDFLRGGRRCAYARSREDRSGD